MTLAISQEQFDYPEPEAFHRVYDESGMADDYHAKLVENQKLAQIKHLRWIDYPLTVEMEQEEAALELRLGVPHIEPTPKADILYQTGDPNIEEPRITEPSFALP